MGDNKDDDSEVIERPDDFEVPHPFGQYFLSEPFAFLNSESPNERSALVLLNQEVKDIDIKKLWNHSYLHVCADAGANRLYSYFLNDNERATFIPQFIVGDFDSILIKVKEYYRQKGTKIIRQRTQYATDYMKSIQIVKLFFHSEELRARLMGVSEDTNDELSTILSSFDIDTQKEEGLNLYVTGGVGGRFDQTIQSLSQLYRLYISDPYLQQFFITECDIIFMIKKGKNFISYPGKSSFSKSNTPTCGLLPVGTSSLTLNTLGFKWDVVNWETSMKTQVSTSNALCGTNGVFIEATDFLTMNIAMDHL